MNDFFIIRATIGSHGLSLATLRKRRMRGVARIGVPFQLMSRNNGRLYSFIDRRQREEEGN